MSQTPNRVVERAKLLAKNGVILDFGAGYYRVRSQSGRGWYEVKDPPGICTCPAFTHGRTRPCKHILAVRERRKHEVDTLRRKP
ncbi:SWIM zinc finger family protein [Thermus caldilimi]|uniref:SWIM zinc finger family protein n=1 Tax=Thermus caldilimi TaxID=2483360 RepID=UPI0035710662